MKTAHCGIKGWCVLVPNGLKKVQTLLPRACDDKYLICLLLNRWLTDKSVVNKQQIWRPLVSKILEKLKKINPFYETITSDND